MWFLLRSSFCLSNAPGLLLQSVEQPVSSYSTLGLFRVVDLFVIFLASHRGELLRLTVACSVSQTRMCLVLYAFLLQCIQKHLGQF